MSGWGTSEVGLDLHLFGAPGVFLDGRDLSSAISGKGLALLAYLAIAAPDTVGRSKVATLLWPDKTEEASSYRLRHTLWDLRRSLAQDGAGSETSWLGASDTHCWLHIDAGARVDVLEFARGATDPAQLADAVALYRGDLLDGLNLRDAPLFDEWLLVERERWQLAYLDALWRLAQQQQAAGDGAGDGASAEHTFGRLIAADPLRERSYRGLMGLYQRRGERAAALRVYEQCARTLAAEMGIAPSPATQQLRRLIAQDSPPAAVAELARAADLLRRGQRQEAWAVCQAAEACAVDPATLSQAALLRAEIALAEGRPSESLELIRAARQALTGWLAHGLL